MGRNLVVADSMWSREAERPRLIPLFENILSGCLRELAQSRLRSHFQGAADTQSVKLALVCGENQEEFRGRSTSFWLCLRGVGILFRKRVHDCSVHDYASPNLNCFCTFALAKVIWNRSKPWIKGSNTRVMSAAEGANELSYIQNSKALTLISILSTASGAPTRHELQHVTRVFRSGSDVSRYRAKMLRRSHRKSRGGCFEW